MSQNELPEVRLSPKAELRPIRGGTDGSNLTARGLPTPNLFTGMQNIHGPLEWISVQDMTRATEMCVGLAQLWSGDRGAASSAPPTGERDGRLG